MIKFLSCVLAIMLIISGAFILEGGNPVNLLMLGAFLIVFFVPLFAALAVWKLGDIGKALKDALGKSPGKDSALKSIRIWIFFERIFYLSGVLGFLAGIILILSRLGGDLTDLAHSFAMDTCFGVTAVFFGILSKILRNRVENQNSDNY